MFIELGTFDDHVLPESKEAIRLCQNTVMFLSVIFIDVKIRISRFVIKAIKQGVDMTNFWFFRQPQCKMVLFKMVSPFWPIVWSVEGTVSTLREALNIAINLRIKLLLYDRLGEYNAHAYISMSHYKTYVRA